MDGKHKQTTQLHKFLWLNNHIHYMSTIRPHATWTGSPCHHLLKKIFLSQRTNFPWPQGIHWSTTKLILFTKKKYFFHQILNIVYSLMIAMKMVHMVGCNVVRRQKQNKYTTTKRYTSKKRLIIVFLSVAPFIHGVR